MVVALPRHSDQFLSQNSSVQMLSDVPTIVLLATVRGETKEAGYGKYL